MKYRPLNSREFDYFIHKGESHSYRIKSNKIQFRQIGDVKWRDEVLFTSLGGQTQSIEERKSSLMDEGWKRVPENEALENLEKEFQKHKGVNEFMPVAIPYSSAATAAKTDTFHFNSSGVKVKFASINTKQKFDESAKGHPLADWFSQYAIPVYQNKPETISKQVDAYLGKAQKNQ
jgi:hypothetical protein